MRRATQNNSYDGTENHTSKALRGDLFERFDKIAEKREEQYKKKKDPNRAYVLNEGLNFLEGVKFFNQQMD